MKLASRLILSMLPFTLGYLITTMLSGSAQLKTSEQIKRMQEVNLPALERVQSALSHLDQTLTRSEDSQEQLQRFPQSAIGSAKIALKHLKSCQDELNSTHALLLHHEPLLDQTRELIQVKVTPLLQQYLNEIGRQTATQVDKDLLWSFYQELSSAQESLGQIKARLAELNTQHMNEVTDHIDQLFKRSLILFFIVFSLSSALVYLNLKNNVVIPIQKTSEALDLMSLGKLDQQLDEAGDYEVGRMHIALNRFAAQLSEKVTQLKRISEGDLDTTVSPTSEHDLLGEVMDNMRISLKSSHDELRREVDEHKESRRTLEEAQSQLIQAEKMSSLGQLVAGVAHEINNPVNFLQSNFYAISQALGEIESLLWEILPDDEEAREIREAFQAEFEKIKRYGANHEVGTHRLSAIVSSLKSFARHDQADIQRAHIKEILNDTLVILRNKTKKIRLDLKLESSRPLYCHPSQLGQVLMNLINNAIYAAERAHIESTDSSPLISINTYDDAEGHIHVEITDNGEGIPVEAQSKIFDPFFTTKPVGDGTGLGLAICYRIIKEHQGEIYFSSDSEGTTFHIKLSPEALKNHYSS